MNVAFYAPLKPPMSDVPSGDRRMARALLGALDFAGHSVQLVSEFKSREPTGNPVEQASFKSKGKKIAKSLISKYELEEWQPDLWFTYHVYYKAPDWIGPLVSKELDIPYVVAEASHAPKRAGGPWNLSHRHVENTIREADLVVGINSLDAECVRPLLRSSDKFLQLRPFINLPVDQRPEKAVLRRRYAREIGLDVERIWFLTAAMMRKGAKQISYEILSKSLKSLGISGWQLLIAGDGPIRTAVELMFDGLPVRFVGEVNQSTLFDLMAAADVFLWPAIDEAYGMAILEGQSQGLPVIAGSGGGVGDIVRDGVTGILTKQGDVKAFSRAIRRLSVDSVTLAEMGDQARLTVVREHALSGMALQLDTALKRLING